MFETFGTNQYAAREPKNLSKSEDYFIQQTLCKTNNVEPPQLQLNDGSCIRVHRCQMEETPRLQRRIFQGRVWAAFFVL